VIKTGKKGLSADIAGRFPWTKETDSIPKTSMLLLRSLARVPYEWMCPAASQSNAFAMGATCAAGRGRVY